MAKLSSIGLSAIALAGCAISINFPVYASDDTERRIIHSDEDIPFFGDWWYQMHFQLRDSRGEYQYSQSPSAGELALGVPEFRPNSEFFYSPLPQPGGGHGIGFTGWMSWVLTAAMHEVAYSGAPVAIMIRNRNCPFPYYFNEGNQINPDALQSALDALPKLDYVLMDLEFEPDQIERNVKEIARIVRNHSNPEVANAMLGNYSDYAGELDTGYIWPNQQDRTGTDPDSTRWNRHQMFLDVGLDVAMPVAYPYEAYSVHALPHLLQGRPASPNNRSATFWAPIEHVSVAARNLESDQKLIPWVGNYVPKLVGSNPAYYHAPPPPNTAP
ncbi:MAG: hypothetical protein AB8C13_02025, partial [Phycisphaerales bacterium]